MTMQEFAELHKLTLEADRIGSHVIDGKTSFKWLVTLQRGIRKHTFEYTMGAGHVTYSDGRDVPYDTLQRRVKAVKYGESISTWLRPAQPKLLDVLECLQLDCQTIDNSLGFNDWASDLGYSDDSIKAKAIYDACVGQYFALKVFFGEHFGTFLTVENE